jgi:CelD/BcsL family acetyltransferase involved in cellulose biosynthesis
MLDVRVHEARTVEDLARHATAWDALAFSAPEQLPMLSHAWVASFFESNAQSSRDWRCLFAYADGQLIGVLPIVTIDGPLPGVRFQGTYGVDTHTRSGYALVRTGSESAALSALLAALRAEEPHYLWIRFSGIREGSRILCADGLEAARATPLKAASWKRTGSTLPTLGAFDDYERQLHANFRRNLRKARNRCDREHEVSVEIATGADARSPEHLDRFLALEASGWKGRAGTAIKGSPRLVDFYSALTERMGDRGWLEWQFLTFDGVPVAGHLAIRFGRSLVLLKIAYDEAHARIGPGNLLFREVAARAFADEGLDEINCLSNTPWHANWRMSTARYSDMVITPGGVLPVLAAGVEVRWPAAARRALSAAVRATRARTARSGSTSGPVRT